MHGSRAQILRGIPLFSAVPEEAVGRLAQQAAVRRYPRLATIFRRGDPCRGLFVVVGGRIRVYRADRSGREQVLHEHGPGQSFAEVPLFDGGAYPASARALEDSEVLFVPAEAFHALYRAEPDVAEAVIRELGRRLRRTVRLIEKISLRDVPSRVALTLLDIAAARKVGRGERFELGRTQAALAEELATTRESVARALRTLVDEGLVEREGATVHIPDPDALEARVYRP